MYQITALYGDAEIAYAEGGDLCSTWDECERQIPDVYRPLLEDIVLNIVRPHGSTHRVYL
jgi:hypothetical protein